MLFPLTQLYVVASRVMSSPVLGRLAQRASEADTLLDYLRTQVAALQEAAGEYIPISY